MSTGPRIYVAGPRDMVCSAIFRDLQAPAQTNIITCPTQNSTYRTR
jgi:hypothetical protein